MLDIDLQGSRMAAEAEDGSPASRDQAAREPLRDYAMVGSRSSWDG
jgi:hypothetical protein